LLEIVVRPARRHVVLTRDAFFLVGQPPSRCGFDRRIRLSFAAIILELPFVALALESTARVGDRVRGFECGVRVLLEALMFDFAKAPHHAGDEASRARFEGRRGV